MLIVFSLSKCAVAFCVQFKPTAVWLNLPPPGKWVRFRDCYSFWPIAASPWVEGAAFRKHITITPEGGHPQGLNTESMQPTAHICEGWPVSVAGSAHASLKRNKTRPDGCYLQHDPCRSVARSVYVCTSLKDSGPSRPLAPTPPPPHRRRVLRIMRGKAVQRAIILFSWMCHLFSLGE